MSKSFPLFFTALGGVALVLGIAYGVTTREYRDAEIETLERKVASIDESRAEEAAADAREAELTDRIAALETALAEAEDRAERAAAEAVELAAAAPEPQAPVVEEIAAVPEGVETARAFGDADRGAEVFQKCSACHTIGRGAEDRIGPHLNGIFGRRAGAHDGFKYSDDMAMMGNDGLTWTFETLDAYIENPKALVSRTRMNFAGLDNADQRSDLLAFLRAYSASPANIPEAPATAVAADRSIDPEILAITGDPEYGEYLSSECTTCHLSDGGDDGIPSITQWPEEDFVVAMHAYKRELRPHPVMQMIAGRLNNEEIAALAAYFAELE